MAVAQLGFDPAEIDWLYHSVSAKSGANTAFRTSTSGAPLLVGGWYDGAGVGCALLCDEV